MLHRAFIAHEELLHAVLSLDVTLTQLVLISQTGKLSVPFPKQPTNEWQAQDPSQFPNFR